MTTGHEAGREHGFQHHNTYEPEGERVRIIGHFVREQTEAAVRPNVPFSLRFFGYGGGAVLGVRAVSVRPGHAVRSAAAGTTPAAAGSPAAPEAGPAHGPTSAPTAPPLVGVNEHTGVAAGGERLRAAVRSGGGGRPLSTPAMVGDRLRRDGGVFDRWDDPREPLPPIEPPEPPGGGGGGFLHAAVTVQLFAPGIAEPVQTWDLFEEVAGNLRTVSYNPPGLPAEDAPVRRLGWWRLTVLPVGPDPALLRLEAHATRTWLPLRSMDLSSRLFDHVFRIALEALVPDARAEGSTLSFGLGRELTDMFGIEPVRERVDISPVVAHGRLRSLSITAVSGRDLKAAATRHNRRPRNIDRVRDDDIALRIQAAFTRTDASVLGFEIARLDGEFGELFLAFNRPLTELTPAVFLKVDFSTLADWAIAIAGLFVEIDRDVVNASIEDGLYPFERPIRTYLREVLSRAIGQRAVLHEIRATATGWQARYFIDPLLPRADLPWRPPIAGTLGGFGGGGVGGFTEPALAAEIGDDIGSGAEGAPAGAPATPAADPPGVFPAGFLVEDGGALARLDRHQSIVVIMMENRSYDHLLGGLAAARPREANGYDGPSSGASNPPVGGFLEPIRLVKARDIGLGTAIPVSPNHHHLHVMFQIGDGTPETAGTGGMAGFARDLHERTDSPQIAMTMYGEADLPVYYRLADEFCVCDRWFCAHPGPTWPNRFATMMGSIPELENFEIDDPQIGFLKQETIFDALSRHGIGWKVFESDLSQIRMFDRFRLDDAHVVPIDDRRDGLDATMRSPGPLPRVMFVEPNFADLPPLATANDDHPPADLAAGQAFVARVLDAIISAGRFDDCLVVVTYDEHGGFYDHVPPPGTPKAEPSPLGLRSRLHPDGPECLGVRVPAFVISPYVSAGAISRTIFDHTSILKSILVHNRARLPGSVLGSFGPRVNAAAHLGQALDRDTPRQPPLPFDARRRQPVGPGGLHGAVAEPPGGVLATDVTVGAGGATAAPPIPPRTVTILPRAPRPEREMDEDPRDFHAALRRAFQPRR